MTLTNYAWEFPTFEQYEKELNDCEDEDDRKEYKFEFYNEHCGYELAFEAMTDHTGESLGEDEREYSGDQTDEDLYKILLEQHINWFRRKIAERVPFEVLEKEYMSKKDKVHYNKIIKIKATMEI